MLLLINNPADLSSAERRLAEWVRWSPAQPGVALLNVQVPGRRHTHQIDALIWTPQECVVVEVKGFRSRQNGVLAIPANGPWRMDDGRLADVYGNDSQRSPTNQALTNTMIAKNWISDSTGRRCYLRGLVLVMLLPGQDIPALDYGRLPHDTTVIVEDFDVFRYYLNTFASGPVRWTGGQIADAIDDLGLSHLYESRHHLAVALHPSSSSRTDRDSGAGPVAR